MELHLKQTKDAIGSLNWNREPINLYAPIEYTLASGGKRIRPSLVFMASNMFDGNPADVVALAQAIEIFHNFTLLHDDLMDNAEVRRGLPTVHCKWSENTAILSGDVMQIEAFRVLGGVPEKYLKKCLEGFSKMAAEICEGQQYDMDFETQKDITEDAYINMIRLKTAVLLGTSLQLGAMVAGANEENQALVYDFGINIGLAFQLQDDYLDVYGDPAVFGKKIGGDILCNKKTYMLISAMKSADAETLKELNSWIDAKEYNPLEKIIAVTNIYNRLNISVICKKKMQQYYNEAMKSWAALSVPAEKKVVLRELADSLMNRKI